MEKHSVKSLYLHYPFCKHLCNYCDFYKKVKETAFEDTAYEKYLQKSLIRLKELFEKTNSIFDQLDTLYIGGGTPSLWGVDGSIGLKHLLDEFGIELNKNCEFTLELNPGSLQTFQFDEWKKIGLNRISVGIQSLDQNVLNLLDRVHNVQESYETLQFLERSQINFSVDFMLGLPNSRTLKRKIENELTEVLKFNPKHISLYILSVGKSYPHLDKLPDEDFVADEFMNVSEFLKSKGFAHYEVSNFAKKGFESKHNLKYWNSESVAALGPSATGYLAASAQRFKWKVNEADFQIEQLDDEQISLERMYLKLRLNQFFDWKNYVLPNHHFQFFKLAERWVSRGQAEFKLDQIRLTPKGFLMLDALMDEIFSFQIELTH